MGSNIVDTKYPRVYKRTKLPGRVVHNERCRAIGKR